MKEEAAKIAVNAVKVWLAAHEDYSMLVRFVCFSEGDAEYYRNILNRQKEYYKISSK